MKIANGLKSVRIISFLLQHVWKMASSLISQVFEQLIDDLNLNLYIKIVENYFLLTTELSNHDFKIFLRDFKNLKRQQLFEINFNSIEFVINKFILEKNSARIRKSTLIKLCNLNINLTTNDILVNPQFTNMGHDNIEEPTLLPTFQPVFDLSNLLEKNEIELLGKGLKYGLKNKNFNQFEILARFEEFAQNLDKEDISNITSNQRYKTSSRDSFLQSFQTLAYDFIDSAKTPLNSLTFDEEKNLKTNQN